ncbi:MAG: serine hydrolase domain-containing protein [Maricaulaceae bacterium]|jgi:CubicO group peptidase (beta-lactamase class C family)
MGVFKMQTVILAGGSVGALALAGCTGLAMNTAPTSHTMAAHDAGLPIAAPESVGFSEAGLDALSAEFQGLVDEQQLAGVTTLLARHGRVVHFESQGYADASTEEPLEPDDIFRIASMTKPIAGVAMMILWEEDKWELDDPVSMYIPEFEGLMVEAEDGSLVPQDHPMTMAELMSHTAGFDVSAGYSDDNLSETDLQGMIDKLAALPLPVQPGTDWRYGPSVNIQGYIVEKLSGQSLDVFLTERIFDPLRMEDTGFWVEPADADRVVRIHTYDDEDRITALGERNNVRTERPDFLSASGGLMSTAADYWRFAQMVANGGVLDGVRILEPETVELMYTNVLQPGVAVDLYGPDMPGIGFGLDFAIVMDPEAHGTGQGLNTHYWGGAYGTWFWVDPTNDVVFVGMIQNLNGSRPDGGTPATRQISPELVYGALVDPAR